jgi:GTP-binding protein EngB required for normal cell division
MNENHKRYIGVTYRHIDDLLREAAAALSEADKDSPFCRTSLDTAPVQHRVVADFTRRVRSLMLDSMNRFGIPVESPSIPASRSALTSLTAAQIDLEELDPKRLQGYGPLSADDATSLAEAHAEIRTVLEQMRAYLSAGAGANLEARLARASLPQDLGGLLRAMARMVTSYGLVVLRPAMARLVEESESGHLEIAIFGRVSSGKSSLLNHILGRAVLPVGVTPVTTLVTRIAHGSEERATVRFATERPLVTTLDRLPAFVTEQENPSNVKHVTSVLIELPEERLREGAVFVDTPGLGSLATAGASETMAYLPRADLGILLSDATAPLAPGDVALIESLLRGGGRAMVALSKADLLTPEERARVRDYVVKHLTRDLGYAVPVHLVSVVGPGAAMAQEWFEAEIRPLLVKQQELRRQSLARKAEVLRGAILEALRARAEGRGRPPAAAADRGGEGLERAFRQALGAAEEALESCAEVAGQLSRAADSMLAHAARRVASLGDLAQAEAAFQEAIEEQVRQVDQRIVALVEEVRAFMARTLAQTGGRLGDPALPKEQPALLGLPIFDASTVGKGLALREPAMGILSAKARERGLLDQMREQAGSGLREALLFHKRRLEKWASRMISALREDLEARTGPYRNRTNDAAPGEPPAPGEAEALAADIATLAELRLSEETPPPEASEGSAHERSS